MSKHARAGPQERGRGVWRARAGRQQQEDRRQEQDRRRELLMNRKSTLSTVLGLGEKN